MSELSVIKKPNFLKEILRNHVERRKVFVKSVFTMLVLFMASCGDSTKDKYIGYWFEDNKEYSEPIQIVKEGEKLYLRSVDIEAPITYNKEDKTLQFEFTNNLVSIPGTLNLKDDQDKMKMNFGKNTAEFSRVPEGEAKKRIQENKEFYDPSFFIGRWQSSDGGAHQFSITKSGDSFTYEGESKMPMKYDSKTRSLGFESIWRKINISRVNKEELILNGKKKYKKIQ